MKTKVTWDKAPKRFKDAVSKLYNAFHENKLYAMDCAACAVGNICNNNEDWADVVYIYKNPCDFIPFDKEIYETNDVIINSNYSVHELAMIEYVFLKSFPMYDGYWIKENQFKALCKTVEYLCELDNIENPMDFTRLFETENDKPKYELV